MTRQEAMTMRVEIVINTQRGTKSRNLSKIAIWMIDHEQQFVEGQSMGFERVSFAPNPSDEVRMAEEINEAAATVMRQAYDHYLRYDLNKEATQ